ncbi:MAG: imidazole glycerol phosphate synthase subunit HisH [Acidimicrobiales bacterium]
MSRGGIAVLDYGIGNLASAHRALLKLGADAALVVEPQAAAGACAVVLPGVGAFGRCVDALEASGLGALARRAFEHGVPLLGICVGLQLLYQGSEEAPGARGLGILAGSVARLPPGCKRPQIQWNALKALKSSRLLEGLGAQPWVYFVHSYAAPMGDETVATCEYGGEVVAAIESELVFGTQFHPEKSGSTGMRVLANFLTVASETGARL